MEKSIIILAAGNGKRMQSDLPKVLHKVAGKTMLETVVSNALEVTQDVVLVYSSQLFEYVKEYKDICKLALQSNPLGTAHAVSCAINQIDQTKAIAVVFADNPFITPNIINDLLFYLEKTGASAVTLAFDREDPREYGRIKTDSNGKFLKIVEAKHANEEEKKITLCNSGIMAFAPNILHQFLQEGCDFRASDLGSEQYITDMIEVCAKRGLKVDYFKAKNSDLVVGVNTPEELALANSIASSLI